MQIFRAAEVLFVRHTPHEEILLGLKAPGRAEADQWVLPGGTAVPGESFEEAAISEVRDELGAPYADTVERALKLGAAALSLIEDMRPNEQPPAHYIHATFTVEVPPGIEPDPAAREAGEYATFQWFEVAKIPLPLLYAGHVAIINAYVDGRQYESVYN